MAAETDTKTPGFRLWFRRNKHQPWRVIAAAATSQELTNRMREFGSGDFITMNGNEHPDDDRRGKR